MKDHSLERSRLNAILSALSVASFALSAVPASAQSSPNSPMAKLFSKLLGEKPPRLTDVTRFDVSGVKLGMPPEEVRATLLARGFKVGTDPLTPSWESIVSKAVYDRRGGGRLDNSQVSMFTMASGPQGEHFEVWYAPTTEGARANQIKYSMPIDRIEKQAFFDGILSKYGTPTTPEMYCSPGEKTCLTYHSQTEAFLRYESTFSSYNIELRNGSRYAHELSAIIEQEVERRAPKNAKASF